MKNWKTSLMGVIAFAPQILQVIGVAIPEPISKLVLAIFGIAGYYFAKDKDVTGVS